MINVNKSHVRIFQDAGLIRDMHEIGVDAPRRLFSDGKWNSVLRGVIEQILAPFESPVKLRHTPWGNDLDLRMKRVSAQFEPDLDGSGKRRNQAGRRRRKNKDTKKKTE